MVDEIVLPVTEPETEWVAGRPLRKVSPTRSHAKVQGELVAALIPWARDAGDVGTEWRFRIAPPGGRRRPLIPDVAFVSRERLRGFTAAELEAPPFAPDVAFEILSPGDRPADVRSKIDVYLRAGSALVVVLDPSVRTVTLYERDGAPRTLGEADAFVHRALPGFTFDVGRFFSQALALPPP